MFLDYTNYNWSEISHWFVKRFMKQNILFMERSRTFPSNEKKTAAVNLHYKLSICQQMSFVQCRISISITPKDSGHLIGKVGEIQRN